MLTEQPNPLSSNEQPLTSTAKDKHSSVTLEVPRPTEGCTKPLETPKSEREKKGWVDPGAAPISTTRWRDMSDSALLWHYAAAILELGEPLTFSLHFTQDVHSKMNIKHATTPVEYIAQRFRTYLKDMPFFFVIERTKRTGILHVHGVLAYQDQSVPEIKLRLKKVCGDKRKLSDQSSNNFYSYRATHIQSPDWEKHFQSKNGILGWAEYCAKDLEKTAKQFQLKGSLISRSQTVHKQARVIFDASFGSQ